MATIKMNIPHNLSQTEALTRVKKLLGSLKEEQKDLLSDLQEEWNNNSDKFKFSAKGFEIAGNITVNTSDIELEAKVPFAVALFKGRIEKAIQNAAKKLLAP